MSGAIPMVRSFGLGRAIKSIVTAIMTLRLRNIGLQNRAANLVNPDVGVNLAGTGNQNRLFL